MNWFILQCGVLGYEARAGVIVGEEPVAPATNGVDSNVVFSDWLGRFPVKTFWYLTLIAACAFSEPVFAQKLVDPNAVAPEYREAALKRRAEQLKIGECRQKADLAKVLPRDRTAMINECLESSGEK